MTTTVSSITPKQKQALKILRRFDQYKTLENDDKEFMHLLEFNKETAYHEMSWA